MEAIKEGLKAEILPNVLNSSIENNFYTTLLVGTKKLKINVEGVGELHYPIQASQIEQLLKTAEFTTLEHDNQRILECYSISHNKINMIVDNQEVENKSNDEIHLDPTKDDQIELSNSTEVISDIISKLKDKLGIPTSLVTSVKLDRMEIFAPKQFFLEHQDINLQRGSIATIMIVLPSRHIGGDVTVQYQGKGFIFKSEQVCTMELKCGGFYSDCRYSISPITDGYRIALIYHVIFPLPGSNIPIEPKEKPEIFAPLDEALAAYFHMNYDPSAKRFYPSKLKENKHKVFTFLLNFQYDRDNLRWESMKAIDQSICSCFLKSAYSLELNAHLTLASVEEDHITETGVLTSITDMNSEKINNQEIGVKRSSEEFSKDKPKETVTKKLETKVTLFHWVNSHGERVQQYKELLIGDNEYSFYKHSRDFPVLKQMSSSTDFIGGKQTHHAQIIYLRAAIVLWPKSNQIVMEWKLNYEGSIAKLLQLTLFPGNETFIRNIIAEAGPYFLTEQLTSLTFPSYVHFSCYLQDPILAEKFLDSFSLTILESDSFSVFESMVMLKNIFGMEFIMKLLGKGCSQLIPLNNFERILPKYYSFGETFLNFMIKYQIEALFSISSNLEIAEKLSFSSGRRIHIFKLTILALLSIYCQQNNIAFPVFFDSNQVAPSLPPAVPILLYLDNLIQMITQVKEAFPKLELAKLYFDLVSFSPTISELFEQIPCFQNWKLFLMLEVQEEYHRHKEKLEDWQLPQIQCGIKNCDVCELINPFLASKVKFFEILSLPELKRKHVIHNLKVLNYPITYSIEKAGSPYKLHLRKQENIRKEREKLVEVLRSTLHRLQAAPKITQTTSSAFRPSSTLQPTS